MRTQSTWLLPGKVELITPVKKFNTVANNKHRHTIIMTFEKNLYPFIIILLHNF